jgi:hypothetical protein
VDTGAYRTNSDCNILRPEAARIALRTWLWDRVPFDPGGEFLREADDRQVVGRQPNGKLLCCPDLIVTEDFAFEPA